MRVRFEWVATILSVFCLVLAIGWAAFPGALLATWSLPLDDAARVEGLRTAGLYLGFAVMLFLARRQPPSPARCAISYGSATLCLALALGAVVSLAVGLAGAGILVPAVVEATAAAAFVLAEREQSRDRSAAAEDPARTDAVPTPGPDRARA